MAGANYGGHFQPQPTSYDYDSPMDEMGRPTEKYFALRKVLAQHLAPGETLPDVPPTTPVIEIPKIELTESASIFDNLGTPVKSEKPLSFEDLDQGYGYVLYRTKISGPVDAVLKIKELRDYAVVCVDGKRIAALDRRAQTGFAVARHHQRERHAGHPRRERRAHQLWPRSSLDNRKGITESVTLGDHELTGWEMFKLPFDSVSGLKISSHSDSAAPFVARGTFELSEIGDTFLDLRGWGKGIVIVNGHNLGRYWYIGPQQTLYCPGVWLKKGRNEIVVFEQIKDGVHPLAGIKTPILDELNQDENAIRHARDKDERKSVPVVRGKMKEPKFSPSTLVKTGRSADSDDEQTVTFPAQQARYLGLQALSSHNGDEFTTLAEINVLDAAGKAISRKNWKVLYVDSEENFAEGRPGGKGV